MLRKLVIFAALFACAAAVADVRTDLATFRVPRCVGDIAQVSSLRLRGGADVTEPVTGIKFSDKITAGGKSLSLTGCGDRKKAIIATVCASLRCDYKNKKRCQLEADEIKYATGPVAVNVYAVGLYVDAAAAKCDAKDEASAAKALKDGTYTKAIKIIMARSVGAQKIGDALAEALVPKVKGTDAPIDDFKTFFGGLATLETGNEIVFTQVGSKLNVKVPSGTKDFASAALCKAMFDIYLGDSPVSPHAKSAMAKGLISMSH